MALEDRVMFLERTVSTHYDEISHNETILLGMAVKMQENIHAVRRDVAVIKGDVETVKNDLAFFKGEVERRFNFVDSRLDSLEKRFDSLEERFEKRFTSVDDQLKQILQLLANRS